MKFSELNNILMQNPEYHVSSWLPGGKKRGVQYNVKNPMRDDNKIGSFAINLSTGLWKDFSNGDGGGDLIALYHYLNNHENMGKAANALAKELGHVDLDKIPKKIRPKNTSEDWTPLPYALEKPKKSLFRFKGVQATGVWAYRDLDNKLIGCIARFDIDGGKEVIPFSYCVKKDNVTKSWRMKGFKLPRPLYGLEHLALNKKITIVVEGEKCAKSINDLKHPRGCSISWPGGGEAIDRADWSTVKDRSVIIWPDNDAPGFKTAVMIYKQLNNGMNKIKMVLPEGGHPEKWDCYDCIQEKKDVFDYIKNNLISFKSFKDEFKVRHAEKYEKTFPEEFTEPLPDTPEEIQKVGSSEPPPLTEADLPPIQEAPPPSYIPEQEKSIDVDDIRSKFRFLGYDHGRYFFLPSGIQQVISMKPADMHTNNLCQLMPLQVWENYFQNQRGGLDQKAAANFIIRSQEKIGVYNSDNIRGRGAWFDKGRVVLHLGYHLRVDGKTEPLHKFDTKYIYEKSSKLDVEQATPLRKEEAHEYLKICNNLRWDKPVSGTLLAGWCVLGIICGALRWRPHIWITSSKGSGKSWIMSNVIKNILGKMPLDVTSNTTEAGMRQALGSDARPILFDEAEAKGPEGLRRIQSVLELLRQASSSDGASIIKGTTQGKAQFFKIRTCGCLSSIGVNIQEKSDQSRITVLSLKSLIAPTEDEINQFREFEKYVLKKLTREYGASFRARAIEMIPVIRKNVEVFSKVGAEIFGSQREGDQIGTLLAGAFALSSDSVISELKAKEWIGDKDWGSDVNYKYETDELDCLRVILTSRVKTKIGSFMEERQVTEIIMMYIRENLDAFGENKDLNRYNDDLKRNGIKINQKSMIVSNSSRDIGNMLKDTNFSHNWNRVLIRIPGAEVIASTRFNGIIARAVKIPFTAFMDIEAALNEEKGEGL